MKLLAIAASVHEFKENNIRKSSFQFKLAMWGVLLFIGLKSIDNYHKIESGISLAMSFNFTYFLLILLTVATTLVSISSAFSKAHFSFYGSFGKHILVGCFPIYGIKKANCFWN